MKAVIFDIDGTLADCTHRSHHVTNGNRDWPAFYAGIADDTPVEAITFLRDAVARDAQIVLCSGRPEDYRATTEEWLARNSIPFDALYMRPSGDFRPDYVVKSQILDGIMEDGYEPICVIDDRPSVVKMWRERGLVCLQCRDDWERAKPTQYAILTLMVGPSGAGKSTWLQSADAIARGIRPSQIVSSDEMRADICGDFRSQDKNDQVFAAVHAQAKARIENGAPAVIDATNIKRKDRLACVSLVPGTSPVRYIVIDRPMADKRATAGWRAELTIDLLAKHQQTFDSQIKDILRGDNLPNVTVMDIRSKKCTRHAA